ncbi:polysaccharide pyruvyl transferase family protein [Streptomyces sp. DSM 40750]|uniref:polysaccharide pyruvyl transferase family protein n=1 Tax=Streptomyces sp. DSM 40750 TaxID=2801030 RepID=UPI00214AC57E|nr:polysaccharide pyruvyl transferase family protein [Streptomyces sp. DSM 40750]UUU21790.1 polysaccharide pyruvyl transferase family protein [Streptomyces sp. DSM 40750]
MTTEAVATWWWRPPRANWTNFGDELGPRILERLGLSVRRVPLEHAELVTVGSIMEHVAKSARAGLVVWGSGFIKPGSCDRRLDIRAVRGRLTAEALGVEVPTGDPGLLVSALWPRPPVRFRTGFVPHYADRSCPSWADTVIDVTAPVDDVVAAIGACSSIASSSLHGVIVAQSFGIPALRIPHKKVHGGDFKWTDHLTALDRPIEAIQHSLTRSLGLTESV